MTQRPRWSGFHSLRAAYAKSSIVVFAGAGATIAQRSPDGSRYGVGTWGDLLDAVVARPGDHELSRRYEEQKSTAAACSGARPWELADWIQSAIGGTTESSDGSSALQRLIVDAVRGRERDTGDEASVRYRNMPLARGGAIRQLPPPFLRAAPTLNAIASLCGQLDAATGAQHDHRRYIGYRVVPNRRIRAVLTPNYDPYMEAAATLKYKRGVLKPVARVHSAAGRLGKLPVFHIHGYVPFRTGPEYALARDLVVTEEDYERAMADVGTFSLALAPQVHLLRHYPTLFIGFSFTDRWIVETLRTIHAEAQRYGDPAEHDPRHFAIVTGDEFDAVRRTFLEADLGVTPVIVRSYREVPEVLGELHASAHDDVTLADLTTTTADPPPPGARRRRLRLTGPQAWSVLSRLIQGQLSRRDAESIGCWENAP